MHAPTTRLLLGTAVGLASLSASAETTAPPPPRLQVEARIKLGAWKSYPTRLLEHLDEFGAQTATPALSRFGGWQDRRVQATGFFRVEQIGPRWWMVDPDGHLYLNAGVNSVHIGRSVRMRQALQERFGDERTWAERTVELLRGHGFNGTACWSSEALLNAAPQRMPYTLQWNFMGQYGHRRGGVKQESGHLGYPNKCIFVFDPAFEQFVEQRARKLAETRDDPYLLGHFSDNELPFPADLLDRYLQLDASDPGRAAAQAWWDARRAERAAEGITADDREAFRAFVVDRYLGIVGAAIRRHDPNHLFFGPRFYSSEKTSQAVFAAAGKHLDAVAVNLYGTWTPGDQLRDWERWSGRPVIITEWYAKGDDVGLANTSGAGWTVRTQAERGYFYQNFVLALIESRVVVGWHWFKYADNDPADTSTDPSNRDSNKGIVSADYEPYAPLLDRMRALNDRMYLLADYFDQRSSAQAAPSP